MLACWSILRWQDAGTERMAFFYALLAGIALALGNFAKFTFIVLPLGVLAIAFLAWRFRQVPLRRAITLLVLGSILPALVGGWIHQRCSEALGQRPQHHGFKWTGTGEMKWRSLLGLKWSDTRIYQAPGYWDAEYIDGKKYLPLLRENDYSYLALLHLGIYSDVLDFANGGSQRIAGPKPEPQKSYSRWSVRLGTIFSVFMLAGVALTGWRSIHALLRPAQSPRFGAIVWLILGLNWFLPLALTLPFVANAYQWGYWLPRLVLPALWSFGVCLATILDEIHGTPRQLSAIVASGILIQAGLGIASVWY